MGDDRRAGHPAGHFWQKPNQVGPIDTDESAKIRRIWLVPLLQAMAIVVMALVTWLTHDPKPAVLDTTIVACAAVGTPVGTTAPCPPATVAP